jgi:hypothetical protein
MLSSEHLRRTVKLLLLLSSEGFAVAEFITYGAVLIDC